MLEPGINGSDSTVILVDPQDKDGSHHEALRVAKEILEALWDLSADASEAQEFSVKMSRGTVAPCDLDWSDD